MFQASALSSLYDDTLSELYFEQCFEIEKKIGSGSFGDVFKVRSKDDSRFYAVKIAREPFRGETDRRHKLDEVAKLESLPAHPNLMGFYRAWEEKRRLYIQTELCETSLFDEFYKRKTFSEETIWNYFADLLMAVEHLHKHNFIHLDIKPDNIFISSEGICKLGDFGLVVDLSKQSNVSEAVEGDPKYLAKDLLHSDFSKAADIFSLGITMLEMIFDLDLPSNGDAWHALRDGKIPFDSFIRKFNHIKN